MLPAKNIIGRISLLYMLFFAVFFMIRNAAFPAWYDAALQLSMLIVGLGLTVMLIKTKVGAATWILLFAYHVVFAFLMRGIDICVFGDPLGGTAADARFYMSCGEQYGDQPLHYLLSNLSYKGYMIDDFGYPIIVWFSYHLFGSAYGLNAVIFFNGIVVAVGAYCLYKLASCFVSYPYAKLVGFIWGMMPFAIYTSAAGLKENFFALASILTFYGFYAFLQRKRLWYLAICILSLSCLFLFRLAVGYFAIIAVLSYYFVNSPFVRRHIKLVLFVAMIAGCVLFPTVTRSVLQQRGYEYEAQMEGTAERTTATGGTIAIVTNVVSGFIGPIPNIVASDAQRRTYITRYSYTPFLKIVVSYFFLCGLCHLVKRRETAVVPLFVFVVLNIVMMIFTFFSMHDRYHWPAIPIFLVATVWGYVRTTERYRWRSDWYKFYMAGATLLIIVFNFR